MSRNKKQNQRIMFLWTTRMWW